MNRDETKAVAELWWKCTDKHRRGITDSEWASMQPEGTNYYVGDIVEFKVGGYGIIVKASAPHDGWPSSYSIDRVDGLEFIHTGKYAWHYELDFKRLYAPSPARIIKEGKRNGN